MVSRTPLDNGMDDHRHLYLTAHYTHNGQTSKSPAGFESAVPANWRPQTHASYGVAIGISMSYFLLRQI